MKEPTIDEKLDIWRIAYSRASLLQAKGIAEVLLTIQPQINKYHRIGLLTGLVVTYARPFTRTQITREQRIIPMHDVEISAKYRELHGTFMEMRNQVFGHKDATGPTIDGGALNQVRFILKNGYCDLHTVTPEYYDQNKLEETKDLSDCLVTVLNRKLDALVERFPMPISDQNGTYVLNIYDQSKPWIVKA